MLPYPPEVKTTGLQRVAVQFTPLNPSRLPMPAYCALIPAAGAGSRFGSSQPKQYSMVAGRPLLHHALRVLCNHPRISQVFVVLAPGDAQFREFDWSAFTTLQPLYCGGATRAASVFNGLLAASDAIAEDDWVLVHDAARPCLTSHAIDTLMDTVGEDDNGGLLAVPVADTLKRADPDARVAGTESRDGLWQAQTPQMFRCRVLIEALHAAGGEVTDEASAVERLGFRPRLVMGERRNLKVTYADDLALAEMLLTNNNG